MFAKIFVTDEAIEKTKQQFSCTDEAIKLVKCCAIKRHFCLYKHIFLAMNDTVSSETYFLKRCSDTISEGTKVSPMKRRPPLFYTIFLHFSPSYRALILNLRLESGPQIENRGPSL
jgi:hypothetical protein